MRGMGLIVYGRQGIGKTSFGLRFPKPLRVISINEYGYDDLDDAGLTPDGCENVLLTDFPSFIKEIRESTDVKTIVVDSMSGINQIMKEDILKIIYATDDDPARSFGSFSEGFRVHAPDWAQRIENAATVVRGKGVNVLLLGHTKTEKVKNSTYNDYQASAIDMESWPRAVLTKWAQAVLFMEMDFKVRTTKDWKGKPTESKAVGSLDEEVSRIMYTSKHPSHDAKNRLELPAYIHMGSSADEAYANFVEKLPPKIRENLCST